MQFIFKLAWKDEDEKEETSGTPIKDNGDVKTAKREKKKSADDKHSASTGGKVAAATAGGVVVGSLTAGIGLLAGMLAVGMGASGSAAVATNNQGNEKERVMQLACDSYHEAEIWVSALETQIQSLNDHIFGFGISAPSSANVYRTRSLTYTPHKDVRLNEVHDWITNSKWKVYGIIEGVRILQQTHSSEDSVSFDDGFFKKSPKVSSISSLSEKGARLPCMRVNVAVNGSVSDTFFSIINTSPVLETGIIKSIRVVEAIDNFTDIIHIKLEPIYLPPTWTGKKTISMDQQSM